MTETPYDGEPEPSPSTQLEALERLRAEYTYRRTVPYGMLTMAIDISKAAVAEETGRHSLLEADLRTRAETAEAKAADASAAVQKLLTERPVAHLQQDGPTIRVVVQKPSGHWTLEALEGACYQFRLAGADDGHWVKVTPTEFTASLPNPELVLAAVRVPDRKGPSWDPNRPFTNHHHPATEALIKILRGTSAVLDSTAFRLLALLAAIVAALVWIL